MDEELDTSFKYFLQAKKEYEKTKEGLRESYSNSPLSWDEYVKIGYPEKREAALELLQKEGIAETPELAIESESSVPAREQFTLHIHTIINAVEWVTIFLKNHTPEVEECLQSIQPGDKLSPCLLWTVLSILAAPNCKFDDTRRNGKGHADCKEALLGESNGEVPEYEQKRKNEDKQTSGEDGDEKADDGDEKADEEDGDEEADEEGDENQNNKATDGPTSNSTESTVAALVQDSKETGQVSGGEHNGFAYDKVWETIFEHNKVPRISSEVKIVIFGFDLVALSDDISDSRSRSEPYHIALGIYDPKEELSKHGDLPDVFKNFHLDVPVCGTGRVKITTSGNKVPEICMQDYDLSLLFDQNSSLQTRYCYWNDGEKKLRDLGKTPVNGIGGCVDTRKALEPLFAIRLPDTHFHFVFKWFGGYSIYKHRERHPLITPMDDKWTGFRFKDEAHKKVRRGEGTEWSELAREDCGEACDVIIT